MRMTRYDSKYVSWSVAHTQQPSPVPVVERNETRFDELAQESSRFSSLYRRSGCSISVWVDTLYWSRSCTTRVRNPAPQPTVRFADRTLRLPCPSYGYRHVNLSHGNAHISRNERGSCEICANFLRASSPVRRPECFPDNHSSGDLVTPVRCTHCSVTLHG